MQHSLSSITTMMESVCSGFVFRTRPWRAAENGGYEASFEIECHGCKTRTSTPLDAIRWPRDTPIWKLEALKCRSCRKSRYAPPRHMIKLTREREITPYPWVHPDNDDRR